MTLTGDAEATGMSKSTLSRFENGQRRPTLELLLALSHAYRVPLDDLVAAPEEGDPRLQLKAPRVNRPAGDPSDPGPGGVQAWKTPIPTSKVTPLRRTHDGYEWICVLSGHMRFILGDEDWAVTAHVSGILTKAGLTSRTQAAMGAADRDSSPPR